MKLVFKDNLKNIATVICRDDNTDLQVASYNFVKAKNKNMQFEGAYEMRRVSGKLTWVDATKKFLKNAKDLLNE